MNKSVTLRGVLKLKVDKSKSIPLSEVRAALAAAIISGFPSVGLTRVPVASSTNALQVEEAKEIVKRFNTGAMSLGSISQETHEALAQVRARALFKLSEPSSY